MEHIQSFWRTEARTDWTVSILNFVLEINRFREDRSIMGLQDPDAFWTKNILE